MTSILFVCTANRFRSPIAEMVFTLEVEQRGSSENLQVSSAGTWTRPGQPVTSDALKLGESFGLDLSMHQSRIVSKSMLTESDLILVMEEGHKEAIQQEFPGVADRVFLLAEAALGTAFDIPDPYMTAESPQRIAKEVVEIVEKGYERIVRLAEEIANRG